MHTTPAYVGIILKQDDQLLMVQRINTDWAAGNWNFPGGKLEANETLLDAAVRETQEELGVTVNPHDFKLIHVLHIRAGAKNTKDIFGFYFIAESWQGVPVNNEPGQHSQIGWFAADNFPPNTTEHAHQALQGLRTCSAYSENGWDKA